MIKEEVPITVYENNDPLVLLHVDSEDENQVSTPYDFTNVENVVFIIKKGVSVADVNALATYSVTGGQIVVANPPTAGDFSVQMAADDLATAGVYRYRVDVIKNDKRETIMLGPFVITNT